MHGCGKATEVAVEDDSYAAVSPMILLLLFLASRTIVLFEGDSGKGLLSLTLGINTVVMC